MTCSCSRLKIGFEVTESRNWNPDCQEHGLYSDWYNSEEQQLKRDKENIEIRELQLRARRARQLARDKQDD